MDWYGDWPQQSLLIAADDLEESVQKIKNVLFSPEGDTHRLHTPQTSSAAAVQDTKPSKGDFLSVVEHQLRGVKLSDDNASAMLATQSGSTWRTPSVAARILCLGLGKPATDRVAQNQLALLLLITSSLEVSQAERIDIRQRSDTT
jgi:hypothetical protein